MKVIKYVLLGLYILFVIVTTGLLLTFNRFSNSVIGDKVVVGVSYPFENYKKGDLLIADRNSVIKKGDNVLFYDTKRGKNFLNVSKVVGIKKASADEKTYVIRNNEFLSSTYVIGPVYDVKRISILGYLYLLFTSKIGYLLFIIVPIIIYFVIVLRNYKKV